MALDIDIELVEQFRTEVMEARNIVIMAHMNPDGDAVGSLLGTYHTLKKVANEAQTITPILPNACPETFRFLPGSADIIDADSNMELCCSLMAKADLIICLDLNTCSRVGALKDALIDSAATKMLVDHHVGPEVEKFSTVISEPEISSTCELIYWVLTFAWGQEVMDEDSARCLYTGICTDTGSFAYSCENSSLYQAVGELMSFPVGGAEIHNRIFNTFSVARMHLLGYCISQRLRIFEEEKFAYFYLSQADQQQFRVMPGDLEVIVNYTLMMKSIEVGAFVKEQEDGTVRVSLRSKYDFDVRAFASTHFVGGGHVKAAGATSPFDFETTVQKLEEYLRQDMKAQSK